jgi:hypothetical protein
MLILRREMMNEEDKFDIITVDFIKKAGKGLGKNKIKYRLDFNQIPFALFFLKDLVSLEDDMVLVCLYLIL